MILNRTMMHINTTKMAKVSFNLFLIAQWACKLCGPRNYYITNTVDGLAKGGFVPNRQDGIGEML
jgi:hypothetical protein